MEFSEEKKTAIVNEMHEILGVAGVIEWAGNTSYLMADLLKANGTKPKSLEEQLALMGFFTEVVKKVFDVDPVIMELEEMKCFRNMEKIVEAAKEKVKAEQAAAVADGHVYEPEMVPMGGIPTPELGDFEVPDIPEDSEEHPEEEPNDADAAPPEEVEVSEEDPPERVSGEVEG